MKPDYTPQATKKRTQTKRDNSILLHNNKINTVVFDGGLAYNTTV